MSKFILDRENLPQANRKINIDKTCVNLKTTTVEIQKGLRVDANSFLFFNDGLGKHKMDFTGLCINMTFYSNCKYESNIFDFKLVPKNNHTLINYFTKDEGIISYKKDSIVKNILITLSPDILQKYFNKDQIKRIRGEDICKPISNKTTNIKTHICARDIFLESNKKNINKLFIQAKLFEILSYELANLNKIDMELNLTSHEIKNLNIALEILKTNYKNPPSIKELSRIIKLNEFKLKYGFKALFDTTPYMVHMDTKMQKAKELICEKELNLSEISKELGYKQLHNFTIAFKKYFGELPSKFLK